MEDGGIWLVAAKAVFLGALPAALLAAGLAKLAAMHRFIRRAYRTQGRVIGIERELPATTASKLDRPGQYGRSAFRPEFEYADAQGRTRTARTPRATVAYNFEKGSEHEILVDPDAADVADIPGAGLYVPGAFLTLLGLGLGTIGLYAFGIL